MLRVDYKNPLEKVYQYEYAVFVIISDMFREVSYSSRCIDTLRIFYKELVKLNDSGNPSYKKQNEYDRDGLNMVNRDVIGRINAGQLNTQSVYVRTQVQRDGYHAFIFECENGAVFAIRLKGRGRNMYIQVKNISDPD